jgi:phage virion morphogenesis protein
MTGARLVATFDDRQVSAALRQVGALVKSPTPIMRAIGVAMVRNTQDRMDGPTDATGKPWAPLKPAYAEMKKGPGILRESLQLQKSLTFFAAGGTVIWGSNKIYAAAQQFGATIVPKNAAALVFMLGDHLVRVKKVTLPARPYLGIHGDDERDIEEIVDGFLRRALDGRGF